MNAQEILNEALSALKLLNHRGNSDEELHKVGMAMTLIEERLAEPEDEPENEPVLWAETDDDGELAWDVDKMTSDDPAWLDNPIPLYRRPPRQPVRLSEDEIDSICHVWGRRGVSITELVRDIESKFIEKNQ